MSSPTLLIWGASGHGKVVADVAERCGYTVTAFVDDDPAKIGGRFGGLPVVAPADLTHIEPDAAMAMGIGHNGHRAAAFARARAAGRRLPALVQALTEQAGRLAIAGVNLSLSVPHDVAAHACGWTPVCIECDRLVRSGVVVVTASGNAGYAGGTLTTGADYRAVSISDPGNTDAVITVGSTHRDSPHIYGVSYFSSRGPTGDGRTSVITDARNAANGW
jgi:hypothetical protein